MKRILMLFMILCGWANVLNATENTCTPTYLLCDYLENPLGIDNPNPRLSWRLDDSRPGAKQTAYQLWVGTDSLDVVGEKGNHWDTGKQLSDEIRISYAGKALQPFTKYYWKIKIWDKDGVSSSSKIHTFETGMMDVRNWQGAWIGDWHDMHYKPAPYFRKVFQAKKKVKSARAYLAAAGLFELYMNGEKIGNHRLDPLYTRFDRKNFYLTFDVTNQMQEGANAIGVLLGNGWYNHQSIATWGFHHANWRNRPAFCMDLRVTYEDGTVEVVSTDRDWRTSSGALVFNSIYTAEHYDARLEQKGWNTVNFDDSKWNWAGYRQAPSNQIVSQQVQPIRAVEEILPEKVTQLNDTTYVFDFARNMSGTARIRISGEEGTVIRMKHGERLYPNGHVDISNIDVYYYPKDDTDPFQTDILTLSGKGEDDFMARFNYKGFRYVEVTTSKPMKLDKQHLTAYFIHSDVQPKGSIRTSYPLIDRLCWATNNAYLSNLMGYPTDCPQREKNGWTGDGHLAIETALYNFDGITVYEKWLGDHRDEQQPNGVLPDIIPTRGWGYGTDNGLDWTSTIAIIPWNLYMFYGDSKPLADCYENIKSYVDYVTRIAPDGLTTWGRGDWVPVKSQSNKELTSSVYYFVDATILSKAAQLFGKEEDYHYYKKLAEKIKNAINAKYLNVETGIYNNGTQTELSVPLMWGIVPEDVKPKVVKNLVEKVVQANSHLDVGVLGAKAILNALSQNGEFDTAYKVAVQDTYPSWGWWIVNGATTLLENWDLEATRDISDNHMMFGEIGAWFYKGIGGIFPDPENPGFKHVILKPNFPVALTHFEAKHESPYGEIISKWERKGRRIQYTVKVPANSTATLTLPATVKDARSIELEAGEHSFTLRLK